MLSNVRMTTEESKQSNIVFAREIKGVNTMENILKIESIEKYYGNKSSLTKAINISLFRLKKVSL